MEINPLLEGELYGEGIMDSLINVAGNVFRKVTPMLTEKVIPVMTEKVLPEVGMKVVSKVGDKASELVTDKIFKKKSPDVISAVGEINKTPFDPKINEYMDGIEEALNKKKLIKEMHDYVNDNTRKRKRKINR